MPRTSTLGHLFEVDILKWNILTLYFTENIAMFSSGCFHINRCSQNGLHYVKNRPTGVTVSKNIFLQLGI